MLLVMIFIFGSLIGSFLNVCILRMPKDESIVFPASHCTLCSKPIEWYDNIPILSFLALGAKCRNCKAQISWQYPIIEAVTGALFVLFFVWFGATPKAVLYLYLTLCLLAQSVIDTRYKIIPDALTLPTLVIGLAASTAFPEIHGQAAHLAGFWRSLLGVLVGGGSLYAAGTIAEWILKKEAMGGGDVKLLAAIGAVLGWECVVWTVFVSSLFGSIVGICLRLKRGEELIPYGPYLALGAFLYMFIGLQSIDWYLGLLGRV